MSVTSPLHEHCEGCVKVAQCTTSPCPPFSCQIVSCDLDCGFRFHQCKRREHADVCLKERVPCINSEYGCPAVLPRHCVGSHLQACPASVVQCTMEWNRWPVYCTERQARVPFTSAQPSARYTQLDVALALRDQRMLNKSMKAPVRIRRSLRNGMTKRFPAVPIAHKQPTLPSDHPVCDSNTTSCTVSDDDSDAPWQQKKHPPGLQASVLNELLKATKRTTDCLADALSMVTTSDNMAAVAEKKMQALGLAESNTSSEPQENLCDKDISIDGNHCDKPDPAINGNQSSLVDSPSTLGNQTDNLTDHQTEDNLSDREAQTQEEVGSNPANEDLMFDHMTIGIGSNITNPERSIPIPPPFPDSLRLRDVLGLDINVESIAPYQHKPRSMYTFLCAQVFRRDEYPTHFKNMHGDIVSNLNGWMEHRCPLASQGCTYSLRRLEPSVKGSEIVYNTLVESFGVRPQVHRTLLSHRESVEREYLEYLWKTKGTKEATPEIFASKDFASFVKVNGNLHRAIERQGGGDVMYNRQDLLTGLPLEILQHISRFLDGFSLSNLSLTCRSLRDVCCSLLEEKGLVVQEWERQTSGDKVTWVNAYQKWMFSTGFHSVDKWTFSDVPHMSQHLQQCPFYEKTEHLPSKLPGVHGTSTDKDSVETIMRRMYPDFQCEEM